MKKTFLFSLVICTILSINSCKKDRIGYGSIIVNMTDAPAGYLEVNVDIQSVEVHIVPTSGKSDWITLPTKSGIYDLLKLQNGIDTSIVNSTQLPTGKITQMRLVLGSNNSIMDSTSTVYPLTVPSGSQSGIKLVGSMSVNPNATLQVLIDFDADKSVIQEGNGDFHLKPVIQVL